MGLMQYYRTTGLVKPFEWGNSLYMDNVDDSVYIPYNPYMDFTGKNFTVLMWVNLPSWPTGWNSLAVNWDGSPAVKYWSLMGGGSLGGINTRIKTGTGSSAHFQYTVTGADDIQRWTLKGLIMDRNSGFCYLVNSLSPSFILGGGGAGTLNQEALDYSFHDKIWTLNAGIGGNGGVRAKKYIDNVSFFDRALSESEVRRIFLNGKGYLPTKIPNCVACYLFDESPGTAIISSAQTPGSPASRIILDQSGNGNHAYATGYGAGATDFVNHHTLT